MSEPPEVQTDRWLPEPADRRLTEQFDGLRRIAPAAPFAPAAAVRRRGRGRGYRRAAATAVATLSLAGLGAGGFLVVAEQSAPPARPPAATATGAPTPAPSAPAIVEIPDEWLLSSDDLGVGGWHTGWEPERFEGEPFQLWVGMCAAVGAEDFPSLAQRRDLRAITWSDQRPEAAADPGGFEWVDQVVDLYAAGGGAGHLDELRDALATCRGDAGHRAVADGFAGDQAMLVEEQIGELVSLTAVVRVGDVVTTLRHYHPDAGRADEERLIELSVRAADRLR